MARSASGQIRERVGADGAMYRSVRFTVNGRRRLLSLGAVSRAEAERALRGVLSDIERGIWREPEPPPPEPEGIPTFHQYAESWWVRNEGRWRPTGRADYLWRTEKHLLPFFGQMRLDEITFATVESYIAAKLREKNPLSARSINMTLVLLAQILDSAVESELIARNPARGRRRRLREPRPRRTYLDAAEQIAALLDAAGRLDVAAADHVRRKAAVATLAFAGLRIGELTALRWRNVDLAAGWLTVETGKSDAASRRVKIRGALRDELTVIRPLDADPDAFVFPTATGRASDAANVRHRVLAPAVAKASETLVAAGRTPLPDGITPHSLRRTFASVAIATGEDPGVVMDEMGHTDPALTLSTYRQALRRDDGEKEALRRLVEGVESALIGTRASDAVEANGGRDALQTRKTPA